MTPRRGTRAFAAATCAVLVAIGATESARAGTYVIRNCNVPGQGARTVGPWHMNQAAPGTFWNDDCAGGGGFGVNIGTIAWGTPIGVTLDTPPAISFRRVQLWMVVRLRSTGSDLFSVVESGSTTSSSAVSLFASPGGSTLSAPYVSPLLAPDTRVYNILINCSGSTVAPCTAVDTNVLDIRGIETTLEESSQPSGSIEGGELMDGTAQSGLRAVSFNANDLESGVASVAILLGKTVVGTADFAAECSYADLAACPRARRGAVSADTRKVADGIYPVSLRIRDAAGNEQTVASPTAIEVANGAAPTQGQASPASAHLTASFAKSRGATLTVNYGRRARIRGRLTGSANEPLGGAVLEASERSLGRAGPARSASVTTAADGTFTYITAAGTSRTIRLAYPSGGTSSELRLRVKASATLAVRLHGITVRYSGRVKSTPLPRDGKLVEVQGRAPGAGWKTFAKRRTSRRGKYSGTYRLRIHRPGVRLQFRVRVPTEPGYPFVAHAGRALDRIVQ